jgi:hypothetical protein
MKRTPIPARIRFRGRARVVEYVYYSTPTYF